MTMCIKENEQLKVLATAAGKKMTAVSKIIAEELIKREIVIDDSAFWGITFINACDRDLKVNEVIQIIQATGIETVKCEHFNAFMELILLGDNDCPVCGGEMEVTDGEYKDVFTEWLLEPYIKIIREVRTCKVCGYREYEGKQE